MGATDAAAAAVAMTRSPVRLAGTGWEGGGGWRRRSRRRLVPMLRRVLWVGLLPRLAPYPLVVVVEPMWGGVGMWVRRAAFAPWPPPRRWSGMCGYRRHVV